MDNATRLAELDEREIPRFYRDYIAEELLRKNVLLIGGEVHRLREIEFYFTCKNHQDPFTHCHTEQSKFGIWYFHRMSATSSTYKGGSFKGLDFTLGNGSLAAGGVLIRSLEHVKSGKIICGPSLCVNYILECNSSPNIKHFVDTHLSGDLQAHSTNQNALSLRTTKEQPHSLSVTHTARIGLYFTKKDVDIELQQQYIFKLYRSVSGVHQISKGRALAIMAMTETLTASETQEILSSPLHTIEKYRALYWKGKRMDANQYTGNKWSDSMLCECYGAVMAKYPNETEAARKTNAVIDKIPFEDKTGREEEMPKQKHNLTFVPCPTSPETDSVTIQRRSTRIQGEEIVATNVNRGTKRRKV